MTRGCLRASIKQLSLLELLLGASVLSVVAGMLQLTVGALQNAGTQGLLGGYGYPCMRDILGAACSGPRCD